MWIVTIEKEKTGPMRYRIWMADVAGIPAETRIEIRDDDLPGKPLVHQVTGQTAIEYTFPTPGQYLVKFQTARVRPDAPDAPPEAGVGSVIVKVAAEEIPEEEEPPTEDEPPADEEIPTAPVPKEELARTGLRLLDWILTMERTEARAFVIGLLVGVAAGAAAAIAYLG